MSRKVYQTIGFLNFTHSINIGEVKKRIAFEGGSRVPKIKFGQFVTEDKSLQKILEADELFNKSFKLIKVDNKLLEKPKHIVSVEQQLEDAMELNANLQLEIEKLKKTTKAKKETKEDKAIVVPDIVNAQQARDYLVNNFEYEKKKLASPVSITNAAKKCNVSFPDWVA